MPTISVTCIREILPELIRRKCHQVMLAIPKIDIDLGIWLVLVPDPARNPVAVRLLDFAHMMWQRRGTNSPGENEQAETNKVESDENSQRTRKWAVRPIAAPLIPAGKNMER